MESVQSSPKKVKIDSVTVDRVDDLNVGGSMTLREYTVWRAWFKQSLT